MGKLPDKYLKEGGPGRPKGSLSGRSQCLAIMDKMLTQAGNKEKLAKAFQQRFNKNPLLFWARYIMPVLPKEAKLEVIGAMHTADGALSALPPEAQLEILKIYNEYSNRKPALDAAPDKGSVPGLAQDNPGSGVSG